MIGLHAKSDVISFALESENKYPKENYEAHGTYFLGFLWYAPNLEVSTEILDLEKSFFKTLNPKIHEHVKHNIIKVSLILVLFSKT
jgi:hypothetical protein